MAFAPRCPIFLLMRSFFSCLLTPLGFSVLASAAACSPSSGQTTGDGGSGGDSASGNKDTGTGGDTGGGGGTQNAVTISQEDDPSVGFIGLISASFDPHYASASACTGTTSGACTLSSCKPGSGKLTNDNGGTVTVTGGKLPGPESVKLGSDGNYTNYTTSKQMFATGDTFMVTGSGAAFPAFSGESAPAPGVLTITGPASMAGTAGPVYGFDPTKALTWTWTGGTAGDSAVFNTANLDTGVNIVCMFDAGGGTGTIPADVVAKLPHGTSTVPANMFFFALSSKVVAVAGQTVSINVTASGQPFFILAN
jgi:hypothetical protein